jgi:ATP-binding cassette subfamily B protein
MELNAEMNMVMTERFNVAGAMMVKLFGRPKEERDYFEGRAGQVRDIGIHQATLPALLLHRLTLTASLATAFAYGFGGVEALHGASRSAPSSPDCLPRAPLRPAHPAVEPQH